MGCLLVMVAVFSPRLGVFLVWLARPALFQAAFDPIFAVLGIILLPFTTLMYALLWSPTGLTTADFLWLGMALVLDIVGPAVGSGRWWRRNEPNPYGM